jgi:Fe-S cluster assembly ATP-binding protein
MDKNLNFVSINDLSVSIGEEQILKGIDLGVAKGEIHALMGPNGSGKSTLAYTLMGHPKCVVQGGSVTFAGKDLFKMEVHERAKAGLFLAFQYPHEVEGVTLREFLWQAYSVFHEGASLKNFRSVLDQKMKLLNIDSAFVDRFLNVGLSGGEKKLAECLQLAVLEPKLAVLDEIDSGLDIDALRVVCEAILAVKEDCKDMSLLVITHYPRILSYLHPDKVHVMQDGVIVRSGGKDLAKELEEKGYGTE